jgi:threonine dehydrogenase-like Zn-dependent dehydrogenase
VSVRALLSGAAGPDAEPLSAAAVLIVIGTGLVGLLATIALWERADQTS